MTHAPAPAPRRDEVGEIFQGGGALGALMRAKDWSQTLLGPVAGWPQSLRTAVGMMLPSSQPSFIFWGADLALLYNDAGLPILGSKHPEDLGQSIKVALKEAWSILGPLVEGVIATGEAVHLEDLLIPLRRFGFIQDGYYTFSYLPIRNEAGAVGGIFVVVMETTGQVVGARRLALIRELSIQSALCETVAGVLRATEQVLGQAPSEVPFALLYELRGDRAHLVVSAGVERGLVTSPVELPVREDGVWPLADVTRSRREVLVEDLGGRFGALPGGPSGEPAARALLLPLATEGEAAFVLVVGLNPRIPLDDARSFLQLLARQLATSLAGIRALEEKTERAAQLAELDRQKTQFFSNVSHEFRTPLTLILGPTEDALVSPGRSLSGEQLERVHGNAQRLLKLVNALLDFARVEAGKSQAAFQPTDLAAHTAEIASAFDSAIVKGGLGFVVDCPPLPEPVWVDRSLWEKVVLNLVSNAFKFTHTGQITVRVGWTSQGMELTVADTGIGIAPEELPKVFQRFHRVEGAQGRSHEGSGIGLSLVESLVKLHGGEVSVRSVLGAGSTFTVALPAGSAHLPAGDLLPAAHLVARASGTSAFVREATHWLPTRDARAAPEQDEPAVDRHRVPRIPSAPGERVRVLLADDNADMRAYVQRLLAEHFTVEAVGDGQAALAAARERPPDLVLSDVMMPVMDGIALTRALREEARTREVPVILLSARAGESATVEGLRAGADDYIVKPFGARELVARIEGAVRINTAERARQRALERASEFEKQLIGIVSHDLRDPLNLILLACQMLTELEELSEDAAWSLGRIQSAAERATRLVRDLLDFTQARLGGGIRVAPRPADWHALVRAVLEDVSLAFPDRRLEVHQQGDGPGEWDPDRLAQVVQNLVTNALKYSPADSPVRVHTQVTPDEAILLVNNGGAPIQPSMLPILFEPLQRAAGPADHAGGSVGLGLYIVKQIVEAHQGTVDVQSTAADGTTFVARLPRVASPQTSNPAPRLR